MHVFDCICTCCTCIPTSSWSAFVWAFREDAIILVASGNSSRFRKKKSFRGILLLTLTLHPHRNRM